MAIKSKTDLLNSLKEYLGEDTSDKAIALTEDLADTFGDFEQKTKDQTDWKTKYDALDSQWREKYRNRFFGSDAGDDGEGDDTTNLGNPNPPKAKTFDDLFAEQK